MATVKGLIFDFDGTLVDSNKIHMLAYVQVVEELGITVDRDELVTMFGIPGTMILRRLTNLSQNEIEKLMERQKQIVQDKVTENGFPIESKKTLEELKERGFKLAIVTGAYESYVKHVLPNGLVDIVYGVESGLPHKPSPDMLIESAKDMGLKPTECAFIGDSKVDAEAAISAGMEFIGIRSELSWDGLQSVKPYHLIKLIEEISDIFDEYPKELNHDHENQS